MPLKRGFLEQRRRLKSTLRAEAHATCWIDFLSMTPVQIGTMIRMHSVLLRTHPPIHSTPKSNKPVKHC